MRATYLNDESTGLGEPVKNMSGSQMPPSFHGKMAKGRMGSQGRALGGGLLSLLYLLF